MLVIMLIRFVTIQTGWFPVSFLMEYEKSLFAFLKLVKKRIFTNKCKGINRAGLTFPFRKMPILKIPILVISSVGGDKGDVILVAAVRLVLL